MKTIRVNVEGIKCGGCASKIQTNLSQNDMIKTIDVSVEDQEVIITGEDELSNMGVKKELEELGFPVVSIKKG